MSTLQDTEWRDFDHSGDPRSYEGYGLSDEERLEKLKADHETAAEHLDFAETKVEEIEEHMSKLEGLINDLEEQLEDD
jgi:predicted  nucleic acid-binding Zn-ribbon protein